MNKKRGPKGPSKWTEKVIEDLAEAMLKTFDQDHTIMILEQLCGIHKIPMEYISRFSKSNEKFCQAIKSIEPRLTSRLFESAYTGEGNPTIGIFALKNAGTKWRDKTEQDITHNFPKAIEVTFKKPTMTVPKK